MSGAGNRHNITSVNIIASLHSSLKARRLNDLESLYVTLPTGWCGMIDVSCRNFFKVHLRCYAAYQF